MKKCVWLFVLSMLCNPHAYPQSTKAQEVEKAFDYDRQAPLELRENSVEDHAGIQVHDVAYASPKGGPVPAYLVVPPGKGPFAGIVFVHWGQGNRSEFLAEALLLARVGAVSVLLDAPVARPKPWHKAEDEVEGYIQMVVDCRRAVDLLVSRPDVDPRRIAYVGHSLGATWGGAIAVSEKRFRAFVLMGGLPSLSEYGRGQLTPDQIQRLQPLLTALAPFDAIHLINHAEAAILFQFARNDQYISKEDAQRYAQAARGPKVVKWYEGSHDFNDIHALPDRADFLHEQVGIGLLRPFLVRELAVH